MEQKLRQAGAAGLLKACEQFGGQSAFADALTEHIQTSGADPDLMISQQRVWNWIYQAKKGVPAEWCNAIVAMCGGKILL